MQRQVHDAMGSRIHAVAAVSRSLGGVLATNVEVVDVVAVFESIKMLDSVPVVSPAAVTVPIMASGNPEGWKP